MKKNYLFIGGSYGIGKAIATELRDEVNVYIASRSSKNETQNGISSMKFDVLNDDINALELPEIIDGFVYCPGSINLRPFKMISPQAFQEDFSINFLKMVEVLQKILPKLNKSENASVLLFSSVAAQIGMPFHSSVSASKGAVEGFAKAFAAEYAPKIRCNVIAPSLTDTPLAGRLLSDDKKKDAAADRHPLKRIGHVEDIAKMAVFLLSDNASWITGQVISVDGGISTLKI